MLVPTFEMSWQRDQPRHARLAVGAADAFIDFVTETIESAILPSDPIPAMFRPTSDLPSREGGFMRTTAPLLPDAAVGQHQRLIKRRDPASTA
jgi:hypothetical protein